MSVVEAVAGKVTEVRNVVITQRIISGYERGVREPPPLILLAYARAANIYVEVLLDDDLDLPDVLPAKPKSEGVKVKAHGGKGADAGRRKR